MTQTAREEILAQVINDKHIERACRRICGEHPLYKDLYQELILILYEYPEEKLQAIYQRGELRYFIVGLLTIMWRSPRSPFFRKFRQRRGDDIDFSRFQVEQQEYDIQAELMTQRAAVLVEKELGRMSETRSGWYAATLFRLSLSNSHRKISEATGIERRSISRAVKAVREHLKKTIVKNIEKR